MQQAAADAIAFTEGMSQDDFLADKRTQQAVIMSLIVLGEVVHMHVHRDCLDAEGRYVDPDRYQPIARLHADNYITSDRQFEMPSPSLASVLDRLKVRA